MRQLLKKLRCSDYLTLVAASSIIRPRSGTIGMMRQYIYRYHNREKFEYLHPVMKELLEETFGVMVFQEDVIKVAHYFAGLNLGEADVLRRAMSGKYRTSNEFEIIRQHLFSEMQGERVILKNWPAKYGVKWKALPAFLLIKRILPALLWKVSRACT